jgi:hypothetical protein
VDEARQSNMLTVASVYIGRSSRCRCTVDTLVTLPAEQYTKRWGVSTTRLPYGTTNGTATPSIKATHT